MNALIKKITRRDLIRATTGSAASCALTGSVIERALAEETKFKRFIVWYVPGGAAQQAFWPEKTGPIVINPNASIDGKSLTSRGGSIRNFVDPTMATYCLQPLQKHISDISLYSGFVNQGGDNSDPHAKIVQSALTGNDGKRSGSIDQILGRELQGKSPFASIYLPVYGHHALDRGADNPIGYLSPVRNIEGRPLGSPNWNPVETTMQLFPALGGSDLYVPRRDTFSPVLQSAAERIEAVKCFGGEVAGIKLETLLASYEDLEKRAKDIFAGDSDPDMIEQDTTVPERVEAIVPEDWRYTLGNRRDESLYWNQPENFERLVDIAIDTTVAAFTFDKTRVSCMQFSATGAMHGPVPGTHYNHLGLAGIETTDLRDHKLSHGTELPKRRDHARIFRWYYSKLAELIDRLKAVPDGDGTLFDSTLIMTATDFGMYNDRNYDVPYIVAGGANIDIRKGEYQDAYVDGFRPHADFLTGVAQVLSPPITEIGLVQSAFQL